MLAVFFVAVLFFFKKVGDEVLCIQLERDLWRICLKSKKSISLFIVDGFEIRTITAQVYKSSPLSIGATGLRDDVLKVNICGLPLSVDDSRVILNMKISDTGKPNE